MIKSFRAAVIAARNHLTKQNFLAFRRFVFLIKC